MVFRFLVANSFKVPIPNALHSQKKVVYRLNLYGYLYRYLYGCRSRHPYTQSAYIDSSVRFFTEQQNTEKLHEVQPAWQQVLVVAAHQTICRGAIRTKTFYILLAVLCSMLMPSVILAVGISERRADSLRACIIMRGVSNWKRLSSRCQ